jgi:sugar-specific transcriptional regulator TrmB
VLVSLGLTSMQARVYLSLARNGPSKVTVISRISGIHRTHLYEVLKSLTEKGFVVKQLSNSEYNAISLKDAAQLLVRDKQQEVLKLQNAVNEIADSFTAKKEIAKEVKRELLLSSNKTYSFSRSRKYIDSAKFQVEQMHTWKRFTQLWQLLDEHLTGTMNRGVKIRQIVEVPKDIIQAQSFLSRDVFANPQFELRFVTKTGGNLTIIDNEAIFLSTSQEKENLGETPLVFSNYEGLLGLMRNYFDYSWLYGYRWKCGELIPFDQ